MEYRAGEHYDITCALLRWKEDDRLYEVPIFDHFHADPQFGLALQHYHIDGRFDLHPRMRQHFQLMDGHTNLIVVADCSSYSLQEIVIRRTLCVRNNTGLLIPQTGDHAEVYRNWYQGFIGKDCKGRRCPHFGTEMLEKDGDLVCPLHGLIADQHTLQVIPAPNVHIT